MTRFLTSSETDNKQIKLEEKAKMVLDSDSCYNRNKNNDEMEDTEITSHGVREAL